MLRRQNESLSRNAKQDMAELEGELLQLTRDMELALSEKETVYRQRDASFAEAEARSKEAATAAATAAGRGVFECEQVVTAIEDALKALNDIALRNREISMSQLATICELAKIAEQRQREVDDLRLEVARLLEEARWHEQEAEAKLQTTTAAISTSWRRASDSYDTPDNNPLDVMPGAEQKQRVENQETERRKRVNALEQMLLDFYAVHAQDAPAGKARDVAEAYVDHVGALNQALCGKYGADLVCHANLFAVEPEQLVPSGSAVTEPGSAAIVYVDRYVYIDKVVSTPNVEEVTVDEGLVRERDDLQRRFSDLLRCYNQLKAQLPQCDVGMSGVSVSARDQCQSIPSAAGEVGGGEGVQGVGVKDSEGEEGRAMRGMCSMSDIAGLNSHLWLGPSSAPLREMLRRRCANSSTPSPIIMALLLFLLLGLALGIAARVAAGGVATGVESGVPIHARRGTEGDGQFARAAGVDVCNDITRQSTDARCDGLETRRASAAVLYPPPWLND